MIEYVGNRYFVFKLEVFFFELNILLEKNKCLFSNLGFGIKGFFGILIFKLDVKLVF